MTDRNPGVAYPSPPPSSPASSSLQITYGKQSPMSSLPPEQYVPNMAAQSQSSHGSAADKDNTSLSLNVDFLKALTDKRTTRDGNPPKRRGPKPDSKPALTRRQELNRQAQRTHRERKELYIKALEDEVLRLKEIYSNTSQDKEKLADENRQLKALLAQNGITWGAGSAASPPSNLDDIMSSPSVGYSSNSGYGTAFTPPLTSQSTAPSVTSSGAYHHSPQARHGHSHSQSQGGYGQHQHQPQMGGQQMRALMQQQQHRGTDMDQAGIDFVLTYDDPSKAYMSPPHH